MFGPALKTSLARRLGWLLAAAAAIAACALPAQSAVAATPAPGNVLTFNGTFNNGIQPWRQPASGAQCANYGTPSKAPRLRGNFYTTSTNAWSSTPVGRFDLPAQQMPSYNRQACELLYSRNAGLNTDDYYGYMFYVPQGLNIGTNSFWGIATAQFHYQGAPSAPIAYELHNDHMTLALSSGACNVSTGVCAERSNADLKSGPNLAAQYVIPPGAMTGGSWYEVAMHVHWASDASGQIQVWYRPMGAATWNQTVNLAGLPTLQWNQNTGCCASSAADKIGAYRQGGSAPISLYEDNFEIGQSFAAATANLP